MKISLPSSLNSYTLLLGPIIWPGSAFRVFLTEILEADRCSSVFYKKGLTHWRLYMQIRELLTALRYMFLPQRRNTCPHCGGIRCIGACQFGGPDSGYAPEQSAEKTQPSITASDQKG